jgi:predicted HicB family RNase H-like nuclease
MVNLTIDPKVRKSAERLARQEGRSLSSYVEQLLRTAAATKAA